MPDTAASLTAVLRDRSRDWQDREGALQQLVEHEYNLADDELRETVHGVVAQLPDLRSQVVRTACNALFSLARSHATSHVMAKAMRDAVVPALLHLSGSGNSTLASFGRQCLPELIMHCAAEGVLKVLIEQLKDSPQKAVRHLAGSGLCTALQHWPAEMISSHRAQLLETLLKAAAEASQQVREVARQALAAIFNMFPDEADVGLSGLDTSVRRLIREEMQQGVRAEHPGPAVSRVKGKAQRERRPRRKPVKLNSEDGASAIATSSRMPDGVIKQATARGAAADPHRQQELNAQQRLAVGELAPPLRPGELQPSACAALHDLDSQIEQAARELERLSSAEPRSVEANVSALGAKLSARVEHDCSQAQVTSVAMSEPLVELRARNTMPAMSVEELEALEAIVLEEFKDIRVVETTAESAPMDKLTAQPQDVGARDKAHSRASSTGDSASVEHTYSEKSSAADAVGAAPPAHSRISRRARAAGCSAEEAAWSKPTRLEESREQLSGARQREQCIRPAAGRHEGACALHTRPPPPAHLPPLTTQHAEAPALIEALDGDSTKTRSVDSPSSRRLSAAQQWHADALQAMTTQQQHFQAHQHALAMQQWQLYQQQQLFQQQQLQNYQYWTSMSAFLYGAAQSAQAMACGFASDADKQPSNSHANAAKSAPGSRRAALNKAATTNLKKRGRTPVLPVIRSGR